MQDKKIILIGDSPAIYICAIYLHTANISPLIIKKNMNLDYLCSFVPGVEGGKEEYNQKCYEQAKHMGITISECSTVTVTEFDNKFTVKYDENTIEGDIVVSDTSLDLKLNDNVFIIDDLLLEREAIVVAGTGCTIAFEIKELLE
jgi:thioredoxin reductase